MRCSTNAATATTADVRRTSAASAATPPTRRPVRGDGDHREVDGGVDETRTGPEGRHRDHHVVPDAISEPAQYDGHLDRLAVLVALVVVERVGERGGAEDPVPGLDVLEPLTRPERGPRAQNPVPEALVDRVHRQVTLDDQRVEPVGDGDVA